MKNLYVMFTRTGTIVGKMIRTVTNYEFSHVSLALSDDLREFYSFSRKRINVPLYAGFMKEKRSYYTLGRESKTRVKIFKIPVSDKTYEKVKNFVIKTANDKEVIYNLFSLLTMPIFHGFETYKQYTCIGFVNEVLAKTGAIKFYKPTYKYTLKELEKVLKSYLFLDGYISNGNDGLEDDYFKPVGIKSSLVINVLFMYECFYRLILKKPSKRYISGNV